MLTLSPLHPTTLARQHAEELFAALQAQPAAKAAMREEDAFALPDSADASKVGRLSRTGREAGTLSLRRGG